jgi:hypothetical protein
MGLFGFTGGPMKKRTNAHLQRRQQRKARHTARRQAKKRVTEAPQSRGQALVCQLFQTIQHFFPDLLEQLCQKETTLWIKI